MIVSASSIVHPTPFSADQMVGDRYSWAVTTKTDL